MQLQEMEAQLETLRKRKAAEASGAGASSWSQTVDMGANYGGNTISSLSTTPSQGGLNAAQTPASHTPGANDTDAEIGTMENHLRLLQRKKAGLGLRNTADVDAQIASVEAHLQRLKAQKRQSPMYKQPAYGQQRTDSQSTSDYFGAIQPQGPQAGGMRVNQQGHGMRGNQQGHGHGYGEY